MNITINGNVTINTTETNENVIPAEILETTETTQAQVPEKQQAQEERQPIDRTNEVLIPNETSFTDLLRILRTKPEAAEAEAVETEVKEQEAREAKLRKLYGEDYDLMTEGEGEMLEKAKRRPGAIQLRLYVPRVAKIEMSAGGLCEVFSNGYAVYDNGDRKTVVWVPDCGSATYYFNELRDNEKEYLKQKDEVGEDVLGPAPWYIAIMTRGEDQIWVNMDHPMSPGTTSDSNQPEEWDTKENYRWVGGVHFDDPEETTIDNIMREMALSELNDNQRRIFNMYCFEGYKQSDIARMFGISRQSVNETIRWAKKKLNKMYDENFS